MEDRCDLLCLDLPKAEEVRLELERACPPALLAAAQAFGEPKRLRMAFALRAGELCGCDLAWICGISEQLVSHHLRLLRDAGLVDSRREGKIVFHSIAPRGRQLLDA